MKWVAACMCGMGAMLVAAHPRADHPTGLVVHEWGTITTRHAPDGTPEGQLNRIRESEALPDFVHRYEPTATRMDPVAATLKGVLIPGRPDVTMRLETPVIYFHPAPGGDGIPPFNVSVRFRGGIVNEFYPNATASVVVDTSRALSHMESGLLKGWTGEVLNNYVVGGLQWTGVRLDPQASIPVTDSHVWLAPRTARSTSLRTSAGEGEQYLFYRGVAHLDALLQTRLSAADLRLLAPQHLDWMPTASMTLAAVWFADIRADGHAAFRATKPLAIDRDAPSAELARLSRFNAGDYSPTGLAGLRASMKTSLVAAGLFDDEAEAMLETWKESYFKNPGLRVFYIVPTEWTTYHLPLTIGTPHALTRVLVGRIDLKAE